MTGYEPADVLFAGCPHTGKTSFLALLYLAILDGVPTGVTLGHYADDRAYLNQISGQLQRCQAAPHTEVAEQRQLRLSLLVGTDQEPVLLSIPDTSGETWEAALLERHWPSELDDRVAATDAVVLFVHPEDGFDAGTTIVDARNAEAGLADDDTATGTAEPSVRQPQVRMPTQVELVDLLQLLCEHPRRRTGRACVVVSAWDLVDPETTPEEWLARNCPLLDQYLDANRDWLKVTVFGVSAQGGRFEDPVLRLELQARETLERANVVRANGSPARPEEVVLWSLGRDD